MAILIWWLSVHAGYNLARYKRPWASILPTGIAMMVIVGEFISNRIRTRLIGDQAVGD